MLKKRNVEPTPKVHDRRSTDLLANALVAVAVVDDPLERGAKIAVMRSTRDDILALMHAQGEIDHACYEAGREYQKYCELAEIGNVQAIDPGKEAVDGGGLCDPISAAQMNASDKLAAAKKAITPRGERIVRAVLVDRAAFIKLVSTKREASRLRERFITYLEILAYLWGHTNKRPAMG